MSPILTLALAFILAVSVEGGVEVLLGQPFKFLTKFLPYKEMILTYSGIAAGIFLAIFYQVDMIASLAAFAGDGTIPASTVGFVLSGLVIGRGSNAVNKFINRVLGKDPTVVVIE